MNSPNKSSNIADIEAEKSAPKAWGGRPCRSRKRHGRSGHRLRASAVLRGLVGFVQFLEALFGGLVAVAAIRVTLLGETAKGSLDLLIAGGSRNS